MNIIYKQIAELRPYQNNPRYNAEAVKPVAESIRQFGFKVPIVIDRHGEIIAGHTRVKAAELLGMEEVPVIVADDLTPELVKAFRLADNKVAEIAQWDFEQLQEELEELRDLDFDMVCFGFEEEINEREKREPKSLSDDFLFPPLSVLNARNGRWQDRKQQWFEQGVLKSDGRGTNLAYSKSLDMGPGTNGTSVFDPVLCETLIRWFSREGDHIIDPFSGGNCRGFVSVFMDRDYTGVDLSEQQIQANEQLTIWPSKVTKRPNWIVGNSLNIKELAGNKEYDFMLTCPPYADLEIYTDNPEDLSNLSPEEFDTQYKSILTNTAKLLKDNSFAVVVMGDVRDKKGFVRELSLPTTEALEEAGFKMLNRAVLVTQVGSGALRVRRQWNNRKLVKTHQDVLIYYNGNPKDVSAYYPLPAEEDRLTEALEADE